MLRNIFKRTFLFSWLLAMITYTNTTHAQAINPITDRVIWADWVNLTQNLNYGSADLFSYAPFQAEITKILPKGLWQDILRSYHFNHQVVKIDQWLVITGYARYDSSKVEDIIIIIDFSNGRIEALCQAHIVSEWYVPMNWDGITPYQVASSPAYVELTYYQYNKPQQAIQRPLGGENCANGNPETAVKRWLEIAKGK
jgi:hypothetical protein